MSPRVPASALAPLCLHAIARQCVSTTAKISTESTVAQGPLRARSPAPTDQAGERWPGQPKSGRHLAVRSVGRRQAPDGANGRSHCSPGSVPPSRRSGTASGSLHEHLGLHDTAGSWLDALGIEGRSLEDRRHGGPAGRRRADEA